MPRRTLELYFNDIRESIEKIIEYASGLTREQFEADSKTIDAVVRNFEILGEAARQLTDDERVRYPHIPWQSMISMRNKVIHEYSGIRMDILWRTVREDIPALKKLLDESKS